MKAARRPLPAWADIILLPLVNVALAFVTVGIIVRVIGVNPFHYYAYYCGRSLYDRVPGQGDPDLCLCQTALSTCAGRR